MQFTSTYILYQSKVTVHQLTVTPGKYFQSTVDELKWEQEKINEYKYFMFYTYISMG